MDDKSRLISRIEKGPTEELQVHLVEWREQLYCDIRTWYKKDDGTFGPTTRGIRFSVELLEELRSALDAADKAIEGGIVITPDAPIAEKDKKDEEKISL
jgi:hypothetical protein